MPYFQNTLSHKLGLFAGSRVLGPGEVIDLNETATQDQSVSFALSKGWIVKVNTLKGKPVEGTAGPEITIHQPFKGLTEDELKAELAKKTPSTGVATSALGQTEEKVETPAEQPKTKRAKTETVVTG